MGGIILAAREYFRKVDRMMNMKISPLPVVAGSRSSQQLAERGGAFARCWSWGMDIGDANHTLKMYLFALLVRLTKAPPPSHVKTRS
jgi:hypothetical protein